MQIIRMTGVSLPYPGTASYNATSIRTIIMIHAPQMVSTMWDYTPNSWLRPCRPDQVCQNLPSRFRTEPAIYLLEHRF